MALNIKTHCLCSMNFKYATSIFLILNFCCLCFSNQLNWEEHSGYRVAKVNIEPGRKIGFLKLQPKETGILFTNILLPEYEVENQNLTIGSGVGLGDVDGDGLCDIYFCSLNGRNGLYKNLGNWKFEDITEKSGVGLSNQLSRAAVFADIDGDKDLDLVLTFNGRGARIFINDGKGYFTEDKVNELSTKRGGTSIALGDVDRDGDLDLYIENYGENTILRGGGNFSVRMVRGKPVVAGRYATRLKIVNNKIIEVGEVDDFYLNDGKGRFSLVSWLDGTFVDEDGKPLETYLWDYGLTVQIRDLNQDGLPDIYVANDFSTPDRIWINKGGGKFQLIPRLALRKLSYASMGIDFADIDRDGYLDFIDLEMLARGHQTQMIQLSGVEPVFPTIGKIDDRPLVPRNTLFWNRGDGTYAEIAWYAGVAATDWSWSPIFIDIDIDGYEDLLIVNGHYRDVNNKDLAIVTRTLNTLISIQESKERILTYPMFATPNVAFRNRRDLTFEDVSHQWGFDAMETSHGIAVADLDNDGDLDVVINCLNAPALVYKNITSEPRIAVRLRGNPPNYYGINSTVRVFGGPTPQFREIMCGSRYLSCDDTIVTFATGKSKNLTIQVDWLSGLRSVITNAQPNCIYEIYESAAQRPVQINQKPEEIPPMFADISERISHTHYEEPFDDFARQPLLPFRLSQSGPGIAWFDLDNDGYEDLIIGSGRGGTLSIYRNMGDNKFTLLKDESLNEKLTRDLTGLIAFRVDEKKAFIIAGASNYEDSNTNGEAALIYEFSENRISRQKGIPDMQSSVSAVAVADINNDGNLELFIAGRCIPGYYPQEASSAIYSLKDGKFHLDNENSEKLRNIGLVTSAVFSDVNNDGFVDLILACEWGQVKVFINDNGSLKDSTQQLMPDTMTGWWQSVATGDFNNDGLIDIIAGNWGLNSPYSASQEHPLRIYFGDFNGANLTDIVEAYDDIETGKIVPRRDLDDISTGLPFVREKFNTHLAYSKASVVDILGERMKKAREVKATTLTSMLFINKGTKFEATPLPPQAQWAPVFGICVADYDGDGNDDVFLAQNFFALRLGMPRLDAGCGLWLKNDGTGKFKEVPVKISGIRVYGEQRGCTVCDFDNDGRIDLAVSQNGAQTKLFHNTGGKPGLRVRLKGAKDNINGIGSALRVIGNNYSGPLREIQSASGYLSQNGITQIIYPKGNNCQLQIRWYNGKNMAYNIPEKAKEIEVDIEGNLKIIK